MQIIVATGRTVVIVCKRRVQRPLQKIMMAMAGKEMGPRIKEVPVNPVG